MARIVQYTILSGRITRWCQILHLLKVSPTPSIVKKKTKEKEIIEFIDTQSHLLSHKHDCNKTNDETVDKEDCYSFWNTGRTQRRESSMKVILLDSFWDQGKRVLCYSQYAWLKMRSVSVVCLLACLPCPRFDIIDYIHKYVDGTTE